MKVLKILLVLVLVFGVIAYLGYTLYLPGMVTNTIETGEIPAIVPKKYHATIEDTRQKVKKEVADLPAAMNKYQLSFDELLAFAEQVENDEVLNALEEMKNTELTSSGQAFDIALKHISADLPQSGKVKRMFSDKIPVEKINSEIGNMENSELPLSVEVDLARRIGIQILKDRKDEIERKLDSLKAN
jgi:hypothetical protein